MHPLIHGPEPVLLAQKPNQGAGKRPPRDLAGTTPIHTSLSLLTEDPTVDPEVDTCPSASLLNNLLEISHIYPGIR